MWYHLLAVYQTWLMTLILNLILLWQDHFLSSNTLVVVFLKFIISWQLPSWCKISPYFLFMLVSAAFIYLGFILKVAMSSACRLLFWREHPRLQRHVHRLLEQKSLLFRLSPMVTFSAYLRLHPSNIVTPNPSFMLCFNPLAQVSYKVLFLYNFAS